MTFPIGANGAGQGTAALIPVATTPSRAAAKAWRVESDRPRAARPLAGVGLTCFPPPIGGTHTPGGKPCLGGGGGGGGLVG